MIEEETKQQLDTKTTGRVNNKFIYKNVILVALATSLNFTSFSSLQNLQSSLHPDVGFIALCVRAAGTFLASFFLPNVVTFKFGYKYPLAVSISGFLTFAFAQFYPKLWLMIVVGVICGCSSAVFWSITSSNITVLAFMYSRKNGVLPGPINQKFFAIFYGGFRSAQITGNLISSLVLSQDMRSSSSNITDAKMIPLKCGAEFCPGINDHVHSSLTTNITSSVPTIHEVNPTTIRNLILIFFSISMAGVLLVLVFLVNINDYQIYNKNNARSIKKESVAVSKLLLERPIQMLSIISIFNGIFPGFIYGDLTQGFLERCDKVNLDPSLNQPSKSTLSDSTDKSAT